MIDLYYWTTPNGHKITMFLEETGLKYKIFPVQIGKGEQFKPEFLAISPNNRIPAMVDQEPKGGGKPISVFESGAMLLYLAEKTGKFLPADLYGRYDAIQWTFWQMGGLGPMAGQNHHFRNYAQEKIKYAIDRYVNETNRLYGVLNKRLADREFIAGDYSIADMASYPWIVPYKNQEQNIDDFPHLKRWLETIRERPATVRAYALAKEVNPNFGQVQQHRAGLEHRDRLSPALRFMIDHRRNPVVRRDRQKLRLELFALADLHRENLVLQPGLFEKHRDLVAVRRGPVIKVDHGGVPRTEGNFWASLIGCGCMNVAITPRASQWRETW